ncbi:laccase-13-like [Mangifera indica]|uniref:laccase-13-like n=1 Tax=Mangifera indica TaxID=29780 RepID=UPI001CFAA309|nr:laccase-13-like [Mangifera indica]
MNEEQFFGIANYSLTVVAAYIKPINTTYIMITPGQTMDILFTANQNLSHYYMASSPFRDSVVTFPNSTATAIVQYEDAAQNFTGSIKGLANNEYPIDVPKNITLCPNSSCETNSGYRTAASLNNELNNIFDRDFPSVPPFFFNFTGDVSNVSAYTAQGTKARMIDYGEAVEIVYQGTILGSASSDPLHLHGFSFYLVGTGSGNFGNVTHPLTYNLVDPPEVNTINLPKNGWATIQVV